MFTAQGLLPSGRFPVYLGVAQVAVYGVGYWGSQSAPLPMAAYDTNNSFCRPRVSFTLAPAIQGFACLRCAGPMSPLMSS